MIDTIEVANTLDISINEIFIFNQNDLKFVWANQCALYNMGYTAEELKKLTPIDIKPEFSSKEFKRMLTPLRNDLEDKLVFNTTHKRKNGTTYHVEVHLQKDIYKKKNVFVAIILDVTERHEQNILIEELLKEKEHQSTTDELTQLPNRRAYNDYMCSLEQSGEPFTIFFIDIDNFKNINDGLAHHVGDLLLKKFSKRISGILERNTRLYRFGGDEFVVVLLGEYDEEYFIYTVHKIQKSLKKAFKLKNYLYNISVSIGFASVPHDTDSTEDVTKYADYALYNVKRRGKNGFGRFNAYHYKQYIYSAALSSSIQDVINQGGIYFEIQPIFSLDGQDKIVGGELLARCIYEGRAIYPDYFIPQLEASGQIHFLNSWLIHSIREISQQYRSALGENFTFCFNVSTDGIDRDFIFNKLTSELTKLMKVNPSIEMELTESVFSHNKEAVIAHLGKVRKLGVTISLDDFGTGYSSLQYISELPIDTIKIDKCFIHNMDREINITIIKSIFYYADTLGAKVVAEGIETEEQLKRLLKIAVKHKGVTLHGQGYYFSRPLKIDDFLSFFKGG